MTDPAPANTTAAEAATFEVWLDASDGNIATHNGIRWPDGTATIHHRHFPGMTSTHPSPEYAAWAAHGKQARIMWDNPRTTPDNPASDDTAADWYAAGCARDCSTQHTYKLGRCALSTEDPPEPMVTISRVEAMDDGAPGIVLRAVPASVWAGLIKAAGLEAADTCGAVGSLDGPLPGATGRCCRRPHHNPRHRDQNGHEWDDAPACGEECAEGHADAGRCVVERVAFTDAVEAATEEEVSGPDPEEHDHAYRDMVNAPLSPAGGLPARIVAAVETALGDELLPAAHADAIRRVEELLTPASADGLREQITAALIEVRRDGMGGYTEAEACQRYAAAALDVIRPRLAPDVEADNWMLRARLGRIITHRNRLEADLAAETALRTERSDLYDLWRAKANELGGQLRRVQTLHAPGSYPNPDGPGDITYCLGCENATGGHPCNTLATLDGPADTTPPAGQSACTATLRLGETLIRCADRHPGPHPAGHHLGLIPGTDSTHVWGDTTAGATPHCPEGEPR